jgi:hypothetical protein
VGDDDHLEWFCFDGYENCSYFMALKGADRPKSGERERAIRRWT